MKWIEKEDKKGDMGRKFVEFPNPKSITETIQRMESAIKLHSAVNPIHTKANQSKARKQGGKHYVHSSLQPDMLV